jgi:protease I
MRKKALILTWSGFQDQEVIYPYYRLLGAGFQVTVVADKRDELSRVYGIIGVGVPCQILIEDFKKHTEKYLLEYDLLILPGGVKSLEKLRQEKVALDFISAWNAKGKLISSTCHGAQLLISAKVAKGKKVAAYYSLEDDVNNAGSIYSREPVVVEGNLITSPHYDFMGEWMETTIEQLNSGATDGK